ncbi:MAG: thiamine phosphate synthase [Bryobacteraceae bacterium]|nr:thiamine phosphate synthase [Bryobacteraceae bacterium]
MSALLARLYPILDTSRASVWQDTARAMVDGGATLLQIRHKGLWDRETLKAAEQVAAFVPRLIVNDRADIARLLGAGVHVGQTDLPPRDARAIVNDSAWVGHSTHNREQFAAAQSEPVDYVAFGPIFSTVSKANPDPVVGPEALIELKPWSKHPVVAIGGITRRNALQVLEAGADSLAVIADLYPDPPTPASIRARVEEWMRLLQ